MRCKACDTVLKEEEIIWREKRKQWEDLCTVCRNEILYYCYGIGVKEDDVLDIRRDQEPYT